MFPPTLGDGWRLQSTEPIPISAAPEGVQKYEMRRAQTARYEGSGTVSVAAFEMTSPAVAFEIVQKWRPVPDTVVFDKKNYFVIVKWENADRAALTSLVRALEKRF